MTLPDEPITPRLGCADNYKAKLYRWDRTNTPIPGLRFVTDLPALSSVAWERVNQDMADAQVTFLPARGDDCCAGLAPRWNPQGEAIQTGIWPYVHELAIFRGDALRPCFMGPLVPLDESVQPGGHSESVVYQAKDILGYFDARFTLEDMWFQDSAPDRPIAWGRNNPASIADWLITQATELDDPGLRDAISITPVPDRQVERTGRAREFYVGEELRDLARAGMAFYTVGRAAYFHGDWQPYAGQRLHRLTQDHFLGPTRILVDGYNAATGVSVVGAVPPGGDAVNTVPAKVYHGGVDPFFGLIERLHKADRITDTATLDAIGRRVIAYGNPPPTVVTVDGQAVLSPEAPVSIHDLVPSRWFELNVRGTCREVRQVMKLNHLRVEWSAQGEAGGREQVQVAFQPPPITSEVA